MLKQVLQELARGRVRSQADLARRLEVSESMLAQMIRELTHRGYLVSISSQASTCSNCSVCQLSKVCLQQGTGEQLLSKRWTLTAKGRQMAKRWAKS